MAGDEARVIEAAGTVEFPDDLAGAARGYLCGVRLAVQHAGIHHHRRMLVEVLLRPDDEFVKKLARVGKPQANRLPCRTAILSGAKRISSSILTSTVRFASRVAGDAEWRLDGVRMRGARLCYRAAVGASGARPERGDSSAMAIAFIGSFPVAMTGNGCVAARAAAGNESQVSNSFRNFLKAGTVARRYIRDGWGKPDAGACVSRT